MISGQFQANFATNEEKIKGNPMFICSYFRDFSLVEAHSFLFLSRRFIGWGTFRQRNFAILARRSGGGGGGGDRNIAFTILFRFFIHVQ
jgi:hypothetical protein